MDHRTRSQRVPLAMPEPEPGHTSARSADQIEADADALDPVLGHWPPQIADEAERSQVYARWRSLVLDARALKPEAVTEQRRLEILGEVYRQGHNLDVDDAAELADRTLQECLGLYPHSARCNWSLVYFDLSVAPASDRLDEIESSLRTLRTDRSRAERAVEAETVLLRLFQGDRKGAVAQIDNYLTEFPDGQNAETFRDVRRKLSR
jgi:hypothetical protein